MAKDGGFLNAFVNSLTKLNYESIPTFVRMLCVPVCFSDSFNCGSAEAELMRSHLCDMQYRKITHSHISYWFIDLEGSCKYRKNPCGRSTSAVEAVEI